VPITIGFANRLQENNKPQTSGAGSRIRTADLLITNQLLYQLSYAGELKLKGYKSYNVKTEGPESHRNFCNPPTFWTHLSDYSRTRE
jgi:hypothetical protein